MTTTADTEQRATALAGALYVANAVYDEARATPVPAATLDGICDAFPEIAPEALRVLNTTPEMAEVLRGAVADRLRAYTAIEHSRIEAGDGYGYIFDLLADNLRAGADPVSVRTDALRVPERLRELAAEASV
ncbi:hypothetical protein [Streptomyces sp. NPDC088812]|uniref:hypothetical protein n=1 Tax=Streptomyces sp. NPDC088812 TaxID=3365905 RepID=UPI00380F1181